MRFIPVSSARESFDSEPAEEQTQNATASPTDAGAETASSESAYVANPYSDADQYVDERVPLAARPRVPVPLVAQSRPEPIVGEHVQPQPQLQPQSDVKATKVRGPQTLNTTPDVVMEITDCRFLRKARTFFGSDEVGNAACVNE